MSIRKKRTCTACGAEIPRNAREDRCDACIAQAADKKEVIAKVGGALLTGVGILGTVALKVLREKK
ncbi:hypothetical protein [Bifidobacterium pseudolongum]|uniref:hypothetical protein n=1 Tax=Bifidobacterium pseudolongum TaxID=1694 RepID=UPI001020B8D6|nr:hypothetical protein [Bifidobacterium pseudolongum]RYQ64983.1 hypothetical protein PG1511B_0842 [Bifidobacterium pseudolongum subsp. globosum]